jgi:hypothetical protein
MVYLSRLARWPVYRFGRGGFKVDELVKSPAGRHSGEHRNL